MPKIAALWRWKRRIGESVVQGYESLPQKKKETNKLPGCQSSSVAVKQMFTMCKSRVNSPENGKEAGGKREERTECERGTLMNRNYTDVRGSSPNSTMYYAILNKSFPHFCESGITAAITSLGSKDPRITWTELRTIASTW